MASTSLTWCWWTRTTAGSLSSRKSSCGERRMVRSSLFVLFCADFRLFVSFSFGKNREFFSC